MNTTLSGITQCWRNCARQVASIARNKELTFWTKTLHQILVQNQKLTLMKEIMNQIPLKGLGPKLNSSFHSVDINWSSEFNQHFVCVYYSEFPASVEYLAFVSGITRPVCKTLFLWLFLSNCCFITLNLSNCVRFSSSFSTCLL